jgi:hypothetical protein
MTANMVPAVSVRNACSADHQPRWVRRAVPHAWHFVAAFRYTIDAVQYYDLELPPDLDIKGVDFSAATFAEVSGGETTSSSVGGRAFVKVYAVSRTTGDQFLVLYEDVAR